MRNFAEQLRRTLGRFFAGSFAIWQTLQRFNTGGGL